MEVQDDRSIGQMHTYRIAFGGRDSFLSGWGQAKGGVSLAFWACRSEDAPKVRAWVEARSDIPRVREVDLRDYRPSGRGHCHIYVVDEGHPALR